MTTTRPHLFFTRLSLVAAFCALGFSGGLGAAVNPRPNFANNLAADSAPLINEWTPAVYPADARAEGVGGRATVRIVVDEHGAVTKARVLSATDPRLGAAAETAVKKWVFQPAVDDGKTIAMCMDVPFEFDPAKAEPKRRGLLPAQHLLPRLAPRTAAEVTASPLGDYPESLRTRRLPGRVRFACVVTPEGRAENFRVLDATHADFVLPALAASARWEFHAATQGDLIVRSELRGEVFFEIAATTRAALLAANGLTDPAGAPPARSPLIEQATDPVWPLAALLKGESGTASVEFTVGERGHVSDVVVREASAPEFGRALVAALETWRFAPAIDGSRAYEVKLLKRAVFTAPAADAPDATDPTARLVRLERASGIAGGAGLDEKLTPLYRVAPEYPAALRAAGKPAGEAVIAFVIDRDGRARLPQIVSATREEFGWAAATAVAQWVFRAPRRAGAPTEVKVSIPITFAAPED
ncbi:MAG: hypothetical protein RLZZ15_3018 [Verrucomicrobiota bacterium]|jgi:TonB family protein